MGTWTRLMTAVRGRRRGKPERFDLYTRMSLYVLVVAEPLVVVGFQPENGPASPVFLAAVVAHALACLMTVRAGMNRTSHGTPVPRAVLASLAVTTAVAWGVAHLVPGGGVIFADAPRTGGLLVVAIATATALAPVLPPTAVLAAPFVAAGVVSAEHALAGGQDVLPLAVSAVLMGGGLVISCRYSVWMVGVVWEQDRARVLHARLAVAEERLRFSRDLHDVVGRSLSVVAVKSELAAELARRGHPGAAEQMLEVRQIAQDSLREVRAVVSGYRAADLPAELAGARTVLRSAGIDCRVTGAEVVLPDGVQEALAWVVREAVTNVVRHSEATSCTVDLRLVDGVARLEVENDGVPRTARPGSGPGSGLRGLRERLAAVGGRLDVVGPGAGGVPDRFRLVAEVPVVRTPTTAPGRAAGPGGDASGDAPRGRVPRDLVPPGRAGTVER